MILSTGATVDHVVNELTRRGIIYNILCRIFAQKIGQNWTELTLTDFCDRLQRKNCIKCGEGYTFDNLVNDLEAFINAKINLDGTV